MQKNIADYKLEYKIYRKKAIIRRRIFITSIIMVSILLIGAAAFLLSDIAREKTAVSKARDLEMPSWIDSQIIAKESGGRSGRELSAIKNIVIHYVGNPGTTAQNNRDYFDKESTQVSSHFIVGLKGEIIQCLPLNEKSAASNWRNKDTISIEVCHPDESGKFSSDTYHSLIRLTSWLCKSFYLDQNDVIRHFDITGKICPKFYVENEDEWDILKEKIGKYNGEFE
ncbi:MAG: peptidoglycan recognition family protein [Acutalibacteraceae bacterium]|nr:peptidoglycan recognition family protein [Acutalibacteraceae bacterium]